MGSAARGADLLLVLVDRVIAFTRAGVDRATVSPASRRKTPASISRRASKRDA